MIKAALGADIQKVGGNPVTVQVSGELIFSHSRLIRRDGDQRPEPIAGAPAPVPAETAR